MSFEKIQLIEPLLKAVDKQGYDTPTSVQQQAIPSILQGKDLVGIAQTGTGKTAAFALPVLQRLIKEHKVAPPKTPRVLVLAPTRELAVQIAKSFSAYGKFLRIRHTVIYGGVSQKPQVKDLTEGVEIVIATPGRLMDLMQQGHVKLNNIEILILDEADRMLDMGFMPDVKKIVSKIHNEHQTLLFSATMSKQIANLARNLLKDYVRVDVSPDKPAVEKIDQKLIFVSQNQKDAVLLDLVSREHLKSVLVFTRTKRKANKIASMLNKNNIRADAIHGNKSQNQRTKALNRFKAGEVTVLVATNVAARGIDIENISHVINYDMPEEAENYIHRIGRTARAGAEGTAYSLCSSHERKLLKDIQKLTGDIEVVKFDMDGIKQPVQGKPERHKRKRSGKRSGKRRNSRRRR